MADGASQGCTVPSFDRYIVARLTAVFPWPCAFAHASTTSPRGGAPSLLNPRQLRALAPRDYPTPHCPAVCSLARAARWKNATVGKVQRPKPLWPPRVLRPCVTDPSTVTLAAHARRGLIRVLWSNINQWKKLTWHFGQAPRLAVPPGDWLWHWQLSRPPDSLARYWHWCSLQAPPPGPEREELCQISPLLLFLLLPTAQSVPSHEGDHSPRLLRQPGWPPT